MSARVRKRYIPRIPKRFFEQQQTIQRALSRPPPSELASIAERAIARQALKAEMSGVGAAAGRALGGLSRLAGPEAGVAAAAAGAAYGIGEQLLADYKHRQADASFQKHGYQEISGESVHTYLPGAAEQVKDPESTQQHTVGHKHGSAPVSRPASQPASQSASQPASRPASPAVTANLFTSSIPTLQIASEPPSPTAGSELETNVLQGPERVKTLYMRGKPVQGFRFPKRPHNYVAWSKATHAKAERMLA
jgi:hypothetical protein